MRTSAWGLRKGASRSRNDQPGKGGSSAVGVFGTPFVHRSVGWVERSGTHRPSESRCGDWEWWVPLRFTHPTRCARPTTNEIRRTCVDVASVVHVWPVQLKPLSLRRVWAISFRLYRCLPQIEPMSP